MKDTPEQIRKFVQIVGEYPQVYNNNIDGYRSHKSELAWEQIAKQLSDEIKEECTVDELKTKWKGIRSSYNRYKNKASMTVCRKYYLCDYLGFLDPVIKPKGPMNNIHTNTLCLSVCNVTGSFDNEFSNESLDHWDDYNQDLTQNGDNEHAVDNGESSSSKIKYNVKRIKTTDSCDADSDENVLNDPLDEQDVKPVLLKKIKKEHKTKSSKESKADINEDLQFFKSILPDIKNFTTREKRKLKMGILQLIDNIDNDRKKQKVNE